MLLSNPSTVRDLGCAFSSLPLPEDSKINEPCIACMQVLVPSTLRNNRWSPYRSPAMLLFIFASLATWLVAFGQGWEVAIAFVGNTDAEDLAGMCTEELG